MVIGILALILGILIFLLLASGKEKLPEDMVKEKEISSILQPFYRAGLLLARRMEKYPVFSKDRERLKTLRPSDDTEKMMIRFLTEKTAVSLLIVFVGCAAAVIVEWKEFRNGYLQEGYVLNRQEFQDGKYTAYLTAAIGEDTEQAMEIMVEERQYNMDEIKNMLSPFYETLEKTVLGNNESADMVDQKVYLVSNIKGYPFQITWKSSNEKVLDRYGVFGEDICPEGELVTLSAEITYGDYAEIYSFPLMVYPVELSREEQILKDLREKIEEAVKQSSEDTAIALPEEVDGIKVTWSEKKKQSALILTALVLISGAAVFWGQSNDLEKKKKERAEQMLMDYPEIVSKMTLFIGAGMTVRSAWKKVVTDYHRRREQGDPIRYVYEEMLFTLYEMESGIGELEAYQRFASRCQVQKYVKFTALLEQNIRLGAKGFLSELNKEAKDSFEERKNTAKQLGETAGSKLMIPMFLMLGIVMVVIMVPSFLSIGM